MSVYVAEISGRGVLAFEAANDVEATTRLTDKLLLRDLRILQYQGKSLWDGVSKIRLREPSPEEFEIWRVRPGTQEPIRSDDDDRNWRVFLIAIVDPTERDDDDDDDDDDRDGPGD